MKCLPCNNYLCIILCVYSLTDDHLINTNCSAQHSRYVFCWKCCSVYTQILNILCVSTEKKKVEHRLSFLEYKNCVAMSPLNQPVSTELQFRVPSQASTVSIGSQKNLTYDLCHALWYMNKMAPRSENSPQHLAAFILMFLNTSIQFLGSNSNDGALKAENVVHFRVHTLVTRTSARHDLSLCVSKSILHGLTR